MKVGILGAGPIAFGAAAYLGKAGHSVRLWSPSGRPVLEDAKPLVARGVVEGRFDAEVAGGPRDAVVGADVIFLAIPAYGHKAVFDQIAPFVTGDQTIIIGSHLSFGALYIARLLAARGVVVPVVAWGTTLTTGHKPAVGEIEVDSVRNRIDLATVPDRMSGQGLAVCRELFGDRFVERDGLLAIVLSNVNPENHMALSLCNLTRMEAGEDWMQFRYYSQMVGRLVEALDQERLAIAAACGVKVRDVFEHFHQSYHVPEDTAANMAAAMVASGFVADGPKTAQTRYVLEDCPFGLVMTARLGRIAGCPAVLHEAGVSLFSTLYGRDFAAENNLLDGIMFDLMTIQQIKELSSAGYLPKARK